MLPGESSGIRLAPTLASQPEVREQDPSPAWVELWKELEKLSSLPSGSAVWREAWNELDTLSRALERAARKLHDRAETFRSGLLHAHLVRLSGNAVRPLGEPGAEIDFLSGEAWLAAQVLVPGTLRTRAMIEALADPPTGVAAARSSDRTSFAVRVLDEDLSGRRLESALALARVLHRRTGDAASAALLGRALALSGREADADRILSEQIDASPHGIERRSLVEQRALLHLGYGSFSAALDGLGAAYAEGSRSASRWVARIALAQSDRAGCLTISRSNLEDSPREAWSWRGWGISLMMSPSSAASPMRQSGRESAPESAAVHLESQRH